MDSNLELNLIKNEVKILLDELKARGDFLFAPDLDTLDLPSLMRLKKEFRDLLRTLGGNRV